MTEPVTYKQLVKELDKRFASHSEHHQAIKQILARHDKHINGENGTPGLRIRVDRIETTGSVMKKLVAGLATLWGVLVGYLGLKS